MRKAVGAAKGSETITLTGAHYPSSSTTVVNALTAIDNQLYSATTSVDKAHELLGTTSGDSSFNANGTYVSGKTTAKAAIEALDAAIVANDADDAALRAAVGVAKGSSAMTYAGTEHYISAQTANVVSGALSTLDANLYEVSGKVDTNKIVPSNTISASTATTGTTIGVKLSSTASAPTTTAATYDGNIIAATDDGIYAFADLNYTAATHWNSSTQAERRKLS